MVNGHHLILGELVDFITGEVLADTHDERHRQKVAHLLVEDKGYSKAEIFPRCSLLITAGEKRAIITIDFKVTLAGRDCMVIRYGPGSLVTRRRAVLAASRLLSPYQIPVAVVTNGENAEILSGVDGKLLYEGLRAIPAREELVKTSSLHTFETIAEHRARLEHRILYAYEVDGSCPCDDAICRLWETAVANNHDFFMERALNEAEKALEKGEFPVGCVIVVNDRVVATGSRQGTTGSCASEIYHAEMIALERFSRLELPFRAKRATLYVTLEPCLMCYGAIILSGIQEIVYAYEDVMGGGTGCDLAMLSPLYRGKIIVLIPNVSREKSISLLKTYFSDPRNPYWGGSLLARYTLNQ